jgi:hypothetical protein
MLLGLLVPLLAVTCGLAINRALRVPLSLAPMSGLAAIAVIGVWCGASGAPPLVGTGLVVALALAGAITVLSSLRPTWAQAAACRGPLLVLALAAATPALLLGSAFAGADTPVSTHDGAFHVETIDSLRRGVPVQMWYPIGFHASLAAVLGLVPWLDTARGTTELAVGLAVLAPLGLFGLARGLGIPPLQASVGAVVVALTYIYPYDDHVWGGWPLSMSIVLLLGLWAVAAHWTSQPRLTLAVVGGLVAGAIVLTHGTEVYSAVVGLAVIAAVRWRRVQPAPLARHLPLAIAGIVLCALPYLTALFAWTGGGGASSAGVAALDDISAQPGTSTGGDWLEFVLGVTGAASFVDLPWRVVLLGIGARGRHMRVVVSAWAVFWALLFGVSFLDLPPIHWLFVATFPWLVQHRPPQMVVVFASLLVASGLATSAGWLLTSLRPRLAAHPRAWRRLAIASGVLLAFFAEGSAITIYKTLDQTVVAQNTYSPDDRAAMTWLRQHARPGELLVNDQAADAGIWAPYKAGLGILLPRSAPGPVLAERTPILTHVLDLSSAPGAQAEACALHVGYLYSGVAPLPLDKPLLPGRAALDRAPGLEEVFSSGETAVFRIHLDCGGG